MVSELRNESLAAKGSGETRGAMCKGMGPSEKGSGEVIRFTMVSMGYEQASSEIRWRKGRVALLSLKAVAATSSLTWTEGTKVMRPRIQLMQMHLLSSNHRGGRRIKEQVWGLTPGAWAHCSGHLPNEVSKAD